MNKSESHILREQGNQVFNLCKDGLPSTIFVSRLTKAVQLYESAKNAANDDEQRASANKNIGVAYNKMTLKEPDVLTKSFYYLKAVESLTQAFLFGKKTKSISWLNSIRSDIYIALVKSLNCFEGLKDLARRQNYIHKLKVLTPSNFTDIHIYIRRTLVLGSLRSALSFLEEKDYQTTLKILCSSSQTLEEGLFLCKQYHHEADEDPEIIEIYEELKEKQQSFDFMLIRAKALKEMANGDELLNQAINSEEGLIMDYLWDALDHFKHASILCREKDIEIEARLYGRVGYTYYKILKLSNKAKEAFETSIRLALSLARNLSGEEWFEQVSGYLQEMREDETKRENAEMMKKREKFLEMCQSEIEEMDKMKGKSHQEFVKFLLQKYPPKNKNFELRESALEVAQMKQTLLKIIRLYHPDKQPKDDEKWCFLSEEISKILTSIYEIYKI